ncbi:MAG: deoxyribose-phosphate aldolase [Eubacterium sp.]
MKRSKYIDHTLLKPEAAEEQIKALCAEAVKYDFASVCVNPCWVKTASDCLKGTDVKVCTVIGFPLGATTTAAKVFEATEAVLSGASEVDMVINIGRLKAGGDEYVTREIRAVREAVDRAGADALAETLTDALAETLTDALADARADALADTPEDMPADVRADARADVRAETPEDVRADKLADAEADYCEAEPVILKVIIETCLLTDDEKIRACKCAMAAGADFVKTSTGFSKGGATPEDVRLMKETVGESLKVKASGGIRTKEDMDKMIKAGADRIGTSNGIECL